MKEQTLGEELRKLRGKRSLREVSKTTGISHTYLRILEKGIDPRTGKRVHPSPDTLKTLARAYDVSYERLLVLTGYLEEHPSSISTKKMDWNETYNIELDKVLKRANVAFQGKNLTEEEKDKVLQILTELFREAVEEIEEFDEIK